MLDEAFFQRLQKVIAIHFQEGSGHSLDHTMRVYQNALTISQGEPVDMDIVRAAALLHDIGRHAQDSGEVKCHAQEGARMAEEYLLTTDFPPGKIAQVVYAIKVHRYGDGITPETAEAAILQDADRLDSLGAITIARVFTYGAMKNRPMHDPELTPDVDGTYVGGDSSTSIIHLYTKVLQITPDTFKTEKAREIADQRYPFVLEFVQRFEKEWIGEL